MQKHDGPGIADAALVDLVGALARIRPAGLDPSSRAALASARSAVARLAGASGTGAAGPCPEGMPALAGHGVLLVAPAAPAGWAGALRAAGARVFAAPTAEGAMGWLELAPCDLAVVDSALEGAGRLVAAIRGQGGAPGRAPVLALGAAPLPGADSALEGDAPPAALAAALGAVMARRDAELVAEDAAGPVVDPDRYGRLIEMAGAEAARELLERLEEDLTGVARGLSRALEGTASAAEVRAQTHVLIALAGAVGATPLQRLAEALNAAAHRGSVPEMARLGAATQTRLAALARFVAAQDGRSPATAGSDPA